MNNKLTLNLLFPILFLPFSSVFASVLLYDQNFETQNTPYIGSSLYDDLTQQTVNSLYGNQPSGFTFLQSYTVETIKITGGNSFGGAGYNDPTGSGGNYALGMLSNVQNDKLGLTFNVGTFDFLNFEMDFSSIGVTGYNGPRISATSSSIPIFRFELRDGAGLAGSLLDFEEVTGVSSNENLFDWTNSLVGLNTSGNTSGEVTLVVDLLQGDYAAMDNFRIAASDTSGDLAEVPIPSPLALIAIGLVALYRTKKRKIRVE